MHLAAMWLRRRHTLRGDSTPRPWPSTGTSSTVTSHHLPVSETAEQRGQWGDGEGVLRSDRLKSDCHLLGPPLSPQGGDLTLGGGGVKGGRILLQGCGTQTHRQMQRYRNQCIEIRGLVRSWKTWKSPGILKWLFFRLGNSQKVLEQSWKCYVHMFIYADFEIIYIFSEKDAKSIRTLSYSSREWTHRNRKVRWP